LATISRADKPRCPESGVFTGSWTTVELVRLRANSSLGAAAVAERLGRSVEAVRAQAKRQRVSLRRAGERRGRILGLPTLPDSDHRAAALERLRDDVLAGQADMGRIERRALAIVRGDSLCPHCTRLPVEVSTSGLCEDCHVDTLIEGHKLEYATLAKQRELVMVRQMKHRLRSGKSGATLAETGPRR
jgi:hypothetical protein